VIGETGAAAAPIPEPPPDTTAEFPLPEAPAPGTTAPAPTDPPPAPGPGGAPPAGATVDLGAVEALVEEARAQARVLRAAQVSAAVDRVRAADGEVAAGRARLAEAAAAAAAAAAVVGERESGVAVWRRRIAGFAVDAYMKVGTDRDGAIMRMRATTDPTAAGDAVDAQQLRIYADEAIDATRSELDAARGRLAEARRARDAADRVVLDREGEVAALAGVADGLRAEEAALRSAPLPVPAEIAADVAARTGPTILGGTLLEAADLAAFVRARGTPHPTVDVEALAGHFIDEGVAEGVRADLAWAQSIIETGYFGFAGSMVDPSDHNYAGIGACDSCTDGFSYGTPQLGARAQIQLLRAYADRSATAAGLARPPVGKPPERLGVRGCCPTWMALAGVWATATHYGVTILQLYNEMLRFAVARRAGAPV
jgi:hypothetical protein